MTTQQRRLEEKDAAVCGDAQAVIDLYYDAMDRKREKIGHLYVDVVATMVWNGNVYEGQENIFKFINSLPMTDHKVESLDAQRLPAIAETADLPEGIIVQSAGTVVVGVTTHAFVQNFVLVNEDGKFKIKSDRFRYVD